jgi:hypothetical protein
MNEFTGIFAPALTAILPLMSVWTTLNAAEPRRSRGVGLIQKLRRERKGDIEKRKKKKKKRKKE